MVTVISAVLLLLLIGFSLFSLSYSRVRKRIAPFVMSFGFRWVIMWPVFIKNRIFSFLLYSQFFCNMVVSSVFGLVLIFVDIILVIVDLSLSSESRKGAGTILEAISLVISFFFLIDVLLRIYVEGLVWDGKVGNMLALYTSFHIWSSFRKKKTADKSGEDRKCCGSCFLSVSSKLCRKIIALFIADSCYVVGWGNYSTFLIANLSVCVELCE